MYIVKLSISGQVHINTKSTKIPESTYKYQKAMENIGQMRVIAIWLMSKNQGQSDFDFHLTGRSNFSICVTVHFRLQPIAFH